MIAPATCANPACLKRFTPRRADQRYHSPKCRQKFFAEHRGDGVLRGAVAKLSLMKGGVVSMVVRYRPVEADNALKLVPGTIVAILPELAPAAAPAAAPEQGRLDAQECLP